MSEILTRDQVLQRLGRLLPTLQTRFGVSHIALYGSFAEGTPSPDSDIDLLVDLSRPLGLEFVALAEYLEQVLGRQVDLATFETLNQSHRSARSKVIAERIRSNLIDVRAV